MSCECQIFDCINVLVSPNDTGVSIGLIAPVTGDYKVFLEFNGAYQKVILSLTEDEVIILPNIVNGNYTHKLKIYQPDGSLLNGTCYNLIVHSIYGSGNGLTPSQQTPTKACTIEVIIKDVPDLTRKYTLCNGTQINLEYPSGTTLTIPHLAGKYVNRPFYLDGAVEMEPIYNSITGTWDNSGNGGFVDGNKIIIQYDEPI